MSRSLAKSGMAVVIKSLKEKWEKSVQSAKVNGEKEIGGSFTITPCSNIHQHLPIFLEWQVHLILRQWQCIVVEGQL